MNENKKTNEDTVFMDWDEMSADDILQEKDTIREEEPVSEPEAVPEPEPAPEPEPEQAPEPEPAPAPEPEQAPEPEPAPAPAPAPAKKAAKKKKKTDAEIHEEAKAKLKKAAAVVKEENNTGKSNLSAQELSEYLDDLDQGYEARKQARQKRARRKRRGRRFRRFLFLIFLLAILVLGGCWYYITNQENLSFMFVEPIESTIHRLDPAVEKVNSVLSSFGILAKNEEPAPTEPAETTAPETEPATTEPETEPETEPAETVSASIVAAGGHASSVGTMKAGEELNAEVASFFKGYSIDASGAPEISDPYEDIVSQTAVLINLDTGKVVAQRGGETVINPASMTKILTILVAAEHLTPAQLDETTAMDQETADFIYQTNCSTADMILGEPVTVRDLFYGSILPSGGDAAMTLAKYVAGSTDEFVKLMNEKVEELGLSDTAHFSNCIGLYDEDLKCTLTDMAMILKAAVENDWCREVLSAHTYTRTIPGSETAAETTTAAETESTDESEPETETTTAAESTSDEVSFSNWFLRRIEDYDSNCEVRCAKTGFVDEAGCCAASYAISKGGTHYICVTGNSNSSWQAIYDQIKIYKDNTDQE